MLSFSFASSDYRVDYGASKAKSWEGSRVPSNACIGGLEAVGQSDLSPDIPSGSFLSCEHRNWASSSILGQSFQEIEFKWTMYLVTRVAVIALAILPCFWEFGRDLYSIKRSQRFKPTPRPLKAHLAAVIPPAIAGRSRSNAPQADLARNKVYPRVPKCRVSPGYLPGGSIPIRILRELPTAKSDCRHVALTFFVF